MSKEVKRYELLTIHDIFHKVPSDRIQDCCRELGTLLAQTKALSELLEATSESLDISGHLGFKLPEFFTWTDDGKGEIDTVVCSEEGEIMRLATRPGEQPCT
ncbi:hypothetical protein ACQKEK_02335 [Pseudomonas sp. NPDC077408]|uniref:hypothetical protein n=1 Tax=Streptomyces parvus TaxID=66428 RepID=UPI00371D8075